MERCLFLQRVALLEAQLEQMQVKLTIHTETKVRSEQAMDALQDEINYLQEALYVAAQDVATMQVEQEQAASAVARVSAPANRQARRPLAASTAFQATMQLQPPAQGWRIPSPLPIDDTGYDTADSDGEGRAAPTAQSALGNAGAGEARPTLNFSSRKPTRGGAGTHSVGESVLLEDSLVPSAATDNTPAS